MLTLNDGPVIKKYKEDMTISDMEFTQLYAWQESFHNRYKIIDGYLCVFYQRDDGSCSCYAPCGYYERDRYNRVLMRLKRELDGLGLPFRFDFVPEDWLSRFARLPGYKMHAACNENFSDYIYKAEDFLCLRGKANEHKRYLVNYFKRHFNFEYKCLKEENKNDAYQVMEHWCRGRDCRECYWGCEKRSVFKILDKWQAFNCKGAIIYVDGTAKAFMVGELISHDMAVSHFQKADKRVKGLYAYLSNEFYIREYPGIKYINLQEDMGIPAIRESKMSYRPCHMLHKYTVTLTEEDGAPPELRGQEDVSELPRMRGSA